MDCTAEVGVEFRVRVKLVQFQRFVTRSWGNHWRKGRNVVVSGARETLGSSRGSRSRV